MTFHVVPVFILAKFIVCASINKIRMPPVGGKKPFTQALPEPALEPIQGTAIVVIQPGSLCLRIGRAADTYPVSIPHCIARRHKTPGKQISFEDEWIFRKECQHPEAGPLQRQGLKLAMDSVHHRLTSRGEYREKTSWAELASINTSLVGEKTTTRSPALYTSTKLEPKFLIGEEALNTNPKDPYDIHWPVRRGRFNLHTDGPGGTLSAVMQDLEDIWSTAIEKHLDIPIKDLKHYRAVLLIPDIYIQSHVKEMMSLMFNRLGFGAAFAVQESVCATFGSGVSSACVVDIGDQKTAISCVEDGLSQKNTRLCMEFGGSDITRCFHWLLCRSQFPYKECDLTRRVDIQMMQELKEQLCHLDQDIEGAEEKRFQVKHPNRNMVNYSVHVGDERLLAPMAIFHPEMFGLKGKHLVRGAEKYRSDPEDIHDEDYLTQTMSRHEQAARLVAARKKEETASQTLDASILEDSQMDDDDTMDTEAQSEAGGGAEAGASELGGARARGRGDEDDEGVDLSRGLIGIDQAILSSIDKCDNDDMKRRMYGCILVVGGGLMFAGAQSWLQYTIWTQMPPQIRVSLDIMDVITKPKDLDAKLTCWKGGAVLCCLDTAQELWIRQREFKKLNVRVLRERAPFIW